MISDCGVAARYRVHFCNDRNDNKPRVGSSRTARVDDRRAAMHALLFSAVAAWTPLHAPIHHRPPTSSPSIFCRAKTKDSWARRLPKSTPLAAGSVVCSAEGSFDHYFMDSIVLLVEHNEEKGSKGVLLTNETPFVVGDMTDGLGDMFGALGVEPIACKVERRQRPHGGDSVANSDNP